MAISNDRLTIGIGKRLKKLREARNLTQPELAHALSVTPSTVSRWERETVEPEAAQLVRLHRFFSVSLDYLVLGEDNGSIEGLQYVLTMTPAGQWAREHKLVKALMAIPRPVSVDFYHRITNMLRTLYKAAAEDRLQALNNRTLGNTC